MFGIIADDLSGACDTAVKVSSTSCPVEVFLSADKLLNHNGPTKEIVALSTNTRSLDKRTSADIVYRASKYFKNRDFSLVYKKVDSLLRGNVSSEIESVFESLGYELVIVCSAVPDNRRVIINGKIQFSADANEGIDVLERFSDTKLKKAVLPISIIAKGCVPVKNEIERLYSQGYRLILADGDSFKSLDTLSKAFAMLSLKALPCGASGWVKPLFDSVCARACGASPLDRGGSADSGRTLIVCGTSNAVTKAQLNHVLTHKKMSLVKIEVSKCSGDFANAEISRCISSVKDVKEGDCVLALSSVFDGRIDDAVMANGEISNQTLVEVVSKITETLILEEKFTSVFITGGETAYGVLSAMDTESLEIIRELMPGVPLSHVTIGNKTILVATKSGGFGEESVISSFIDYIGNN